MKTIFCKLFGDNNDPFLPVRREA